MHRSSLSLASLRPQIQRAIDYIKSCQQSDGAIRWYTKAKLDPWDHTEAAMALAVGGEQAASAAAFSWLKKTQQIDGSWFAEYNGKENTLSPVGDKIETNFVAYPATGVWHYFLIYKDTRFLQNCFSMIEGATEYVLQYQSEEGEIQWATSPGEALAKDALVTACASVLRSLECAIFIADELKLPKPHWKQAHYKLRQALLNKPWRFDRTWESKRRYSMDWFYPILAGIYTREEACVRLDDRWHEFVRADLGCRCVNDEPWITVAESCELVMASVAAGRRNKAADIFRSLSQWQDSDGGFWTGYSYRDRLIWPKEKTSWTAAAYVLAADALFEISPAAGLFTSAASEHAAPTQPSIPPFRAR